MFHAVLFLDRFASTREPRSNLRHKKREGHLSIADWLDAMGRKRKTGDCPVLPPPPQKPPSSGLQEKDSMYPLWLFMSHRRGVMYHLDPFFFGQDLAVPSAPAPAISASVIHSSSRNRVRQALPSSNPIESKLLLQLVILLLFHHASPQSKYRPLTIHAAAAWAENGDEDGDQINAPDPTTAPKVRLSRLTTRSPRRSTEPTISLPCYLFRHLGTTGSGRIP